MQESSEGGTGRKGQNGGMGKKTPSSGKARGKAGRKKSFWECVPGVCDFNDTRHKGQHRRTCQRYKATQDPRLAKTISDVLRFCGLPLDVIRSWGPLERLDRLPNFRHIQPSPVARHSRWYIGALAQDDGGIVPTGEDKGMPSVVDVLSNVRQELRSELQERGKKRGHSGLEKATKIGEEKAGELWSATTLLAMDASALNSFIGNVSNARPEARRILNLPGKTVLSSTAREMYSKTAIPLLKEAWGGEGDNSLERWDVEGDSMNITPRGVVTEIHYDTLPHCSGAEALTTEHTGPLKLWLIYPSTEVARFGYIGDTEQGVGQLEHGAFLVQMPGERVCVPPYSPHAVLTLNTCYIYGWSMDDSKLLDPTTVSAEMRSNAKDVEQACTRVLERLEMGLVSADWWMRSMRQFVQQWGAEKEYFKDGGMVEKLEDLLIGQWSDDDGCTWCLAVGLEGGRGIEGEEEAREHIKQHCRV